VPEVDDDGVRVGEASNTLALAVPDPVGERLGDEVCETEAAVLRVSVGVGDPETALVVEAEGVSLPVGERDDVPVREAGPGDGVGEDDAAFAVGDTDDEAGREGERELEPVTEGVRVLEGETVGVRVLDGEKDGVRVFDGVTVHVKSPEGVSLLVSAEVPEREPVPVGVPVVDAPVDKDLVADGVTEGVRVELLVIVRVRDDVRVAVLVLLTEGGGHVGVAPSSIRRIRLFPVSVIQSVDPATAIPEGPRNNADVPSRKPGRPAVEPESEFTTTKGQSFTSTTTRILLLNRSATYRELP
jgi:hypothetical protein